MCPTTAYVEPPPTYWHALLIAIAYSEHEDHRARLVEPHGDVDKIRRFLLRRGWLDENIVILSDEKPAGDDSQDGSQEGEERGYPEPTKENILKALVDLIQPAVDNPAQSHKFFFYYAGHGAQEVDLTGEEDDGWNECIVPLRSQVLTALHIEEPPLPQASQTRPSTPLPPLPPPPPPPPPQRAHPVRRQSAKIKFLPSDCPFDMELVGRRRGALSPALSPAQAGSGFGTGTDGEMNSEQGASEGERLLPMTTEDHGWINDDTLCDLLCRRLPATCRLIAFFDMCHSGTALDLPENYTWKEVPVRHRWRFNWVEHYIPPDQRKSKHFLWIIKPTVKGDSVHPAGPHKPRKAAWRRTKSFPAAIHHTRSVPVQMPATLAISATPAIPAMDKLSKWSFQNIRRVVREMFRSHRRIVSAPVGPITAHAEPVIIVESTDDEPMFLPDLSYTSPYASGIIDDGATSPKNLLFNPLELSPLSAPETLLTPSTPGSSSIDLSLSGLSGATGRLQVPSFPSSAGINRVRSASAPPIMPSPKPPIVADIVCLGAAKDSQLAYDDRSLAKLLLELYDTFGDEPTLYQLLLWITRRVRKPQIPQLSSSRDLSNDWHRAFLV